MEQEIQTGVGYLVGYSFTFGVIRSRSADGPRSPEFETGAGGIRSAMPAAEIARGRVDVHCVISVRHIKGLSLIHI